jgi:hypothetical protein
MKRKLHLLAMILLGLLLSAACSPVKRVLGNPEYLEQVARVVVKQGYCINDTTLESVSRTDTVFQEVTVTDSVLVRVPATCEMDTTTRSGFRVIIRHGILHVSHAGKRKEVLRTLTHTSFIRDRKLEDLLKQDLAALQASLDSVTLVLTDTKAQLDATSRQLRRVEAKCLFLSALLTLIILGGIYLRLRKLLPLLP